MDRSHYLTGIFVGCFFPHFQKHCGNDSFTSSDYFSTHFIYYFLVEICPSRQCYHTDGKKPFKCWPLLSVLHKDEGREKAVSYDFSFLESLCCTV